MTEQEKNQTFNITELSVYIGISKRTMFRKIKNGQFPVVPIKGTKPHRWDKTAVDKWKSNGGEFTA